MEFRRSKQKSTQTRTNVKFTDSSVLHTLKNISDVFHLAMLIDKIFASLIQENKRTKT